ncbi:MAG: type IV secretion system protein [Gammaproteobacteria bacterium]|nr:type IV secretion system protein [Gammaproteobacteria bacterium]MBL4729711.1 type IV secretion system protein [Gammaproteobacteria bacterium]
MENINTGNVPEMLLGLIDDLSSEYIEVTFGNLWAFLEVSFRNVLILFFILFGYALWRGLIKVPFKDIIEWVVKIGIIYTFISTWEIYNTIVVAFFTTGPDVLVGAALGDGSTGSVSTHLGTVYQRAINMAGDAYNSGGFVMPYIIGSIILISASLMLLYALFLIAMSKIAIAILLGLGPLFIVFLMFEKTQKMFESWLQQLVNYVFISLFTVAVLAFGSFLAEKTILVTNDTTLGSAMLPAITFLLVFMFLTQVMSIASSLSGGIALTTNHAGTLLGYAGGTAIGSAGAAASGVIRRGGRSVADRLGRGSITGQ